MGMSTFMFVFVCARVCMCACTTFGDSALRPGLAPAGRTWLPASYSLPRPASFEGASGSRLRLPRLDGKGVEPEGEGVVSEHTRYMSMEELGGRGDSSSRESDLRIPERA